MANQIELEMPDVVLPGEEFVIRVIVSGAEKFRVLKILVKHGTEPDREARIDVRADGTGSDFLRVTVDKAGRTMFCPEDPDGVLFGECKSIDVLELA
jgi:hypothetical protein